METSSITTCPVQFESGTRRRIDLSGTWRHQITTNADRPDEAAAWEDFEVPGWKSAVRKDVPYFLWFRRTIEVPANWHGKRVVLNLRAARNTPKVFIDGKEISGQDNSLPLETPLEIHEGSKVSFIRLTMLAGRMW